MSSPSQEKKEHPWKGATSWTWRNRKGWPPEGPWKTEPDKIVWIDKKTGLDCMMRRGGVGAWCGYVGVGKAHPLHGKGYDDVQELLEEDVHYRGVHGSLTFADTCESKEGAKYPERLLCHDGHDEDDSVWWFGFDAAHGGDFLPEANVSYAALSLFQYTGYEGSSYRKMGYIKEKCLHLARALRRAA